MLEPLIGYVCRREGDAYMDGRPTQGAPGKVGRRREMEGGLTFPPIAFTSIAFFTDDLNCFLIWNMLSMSPSSVSF